MMCPNCGAENPDYAEYCGKCAQRLKTGEGSTTSESTSPASANGLAPAYRPKTSLRDSPLSLAFLALIISLILFSISFALFVYWDERYLQFALGSEHDFGNLDSIMRIDRISTYVSGFGSISAIVGLVFFVRAFMGIQGRDRPSVKGGIAELKGAIWLFVLAAILFAIYVFVMIAVSEFHASMDVRIIWRLSYMNAIARLLGVAALLLLVNSFRRAEARL